MEGRRGWLFSGGDDVAVPFVNLSNLVFFRQGLSALIRFVPAFKTATTDRLLYPE